MPLVTKPLRDLYYLMLEKTAEHDLEEKMSEPGIINQSEPNLLDSGPMEGVEMTDNLSPSAVDPGNSQNSDHGSMLDEPES